LTAALEVRDVFRVYQTPESDAAALQGLTLSVDEGEIVVVLGPSGSGKTTLLRLLAGLERPSAGVVRVFGADVASLRGRSLAEYRARQLGYVEQHYWRSLDPHLAARDLVALQLALGGASRDVRNRRADELLERVGLREKRDARPTELSGGEQQRVALCAALAHRPRLLLADEPTGELDAVTARVVYEVLAALAREARCTTLIVSHDPSSSSIADRTIRVRDGRISGEARSVDGRGEAIVVGRGGWLRLPEELLARARISSRATARLAAGGVVLSSADDRTAQRAPATPPTVEAMPSKRRGQAAAVHSLEVQAGRPPTPIFSALDWSFQFSRLSVITGPSGSGKTTLLHILAGLRLPTSGDVRVLGSALSSLDRAGRADFRRSHIAVIGQQLGLIPFLSARENVELGLALRGGERRRAASRADEALVAVGLAERRGQRMDRLSAGERQRVAIARSLVAEPAILLADEPTARLDAANAVAIGTLFTQLAAEFGTAIICATHDPLLVEQSDDVLSLDGTTGASV
jgi:ABC-type lipoprotein export system ATPase subunit